MDTPWLYVSMAHKLSRPQSHTLQLSAELSARKWLSVRGLALEALLKDSGREREARLHLYTPTLTYVKVSSKGGLIFISLSVNDPNCHSIREARLSSNLK